MLRDASWRGFSLNKPCCISSWNLLFLYQVSFCEDSGCFVPFLLKVQAICFLLLLQTPPEKQQRPKSLQFGDRRLTLSLFQGSQLSLSNPLSPLPASPNTPHTPRSSSMHHKLQPASTHVLFSSTFFPLTFLSFTHKMRECLCTCVRTFLISSCNNPQMHVVWKAFLSLLLC